jgi:hypothetical protein
MAAYRAPSVSNNHTDRNECNQHWSDSDAVTKIADDAITNQLASLQIAADVATTQYTAAIALAVDLADGAVATTDAKIAAEAQLMDP